MTARRSRRRPVVTAVVVTTVVVAVLALLRLAALHLGATEGDVPSAAAVGLPEGSAVVDEQKECASGGCWAVIAVRPPEGTTPRELAERLGTRPRAQRAGTLWDPRTVNLDADVQGELLVVRADYWSRSAGA